MLTLKIGKMYVSEIIIDETTPLTNFITDIGFTYQLDDVIECESVDEANKIKEIISSLLDIESYKIEIIMLGDKDEDTN